MIDYGEPLAQRLNSEPVIFHGCTSTELITLAIMSVVTWLPVGGIVGGVFIGSFPLGMGIAVVGILLTIFIVPKLFQKMKRGKPDGYYQVRIFIFLQKAKFFRNSGLFEVQYIRDSIRWDLGRTR